MSAPDTTTLLLIRTSITRICLLSSCLPATVKEGTPDGKIASAMAQTGEDVWGTFNKRFDHMFGEDTRDKSTGRLRHLTKGPHGMDLVCTYLRDVATNQLDSLPLDLVEIKIKRLRDELQYYAE
jgi:hypothetical protein